MGGGGIGPGGIAGAAAGTVAAATVAAATVTAAEAGSGAEIVGGPAVVDADGAVGGGVANPGSADMAGIFANGGCRSLALEKPKHHVLTVESQREALNGSDQRKQRIIVDCGGHFLFCHGVG